MKGGGDNWSHQTKMSTILLNLVLLPLSANNTCLNKSCATRTFQTVADPAAYCSWMHK